MPGDVPMINMGDEVTVDRHVLPEAAAVHLPWLGVIPSSPCLGLVVADFEGDVTGRPQDTFDMTKNLQPRRVVQEVLRDVASHDNQVRQGIGKVCGCAVQPRHTVGIGLLTSDLKHHRLWLDADHLVAAAG